MFNGNPSLELLYVSHQTEKMDGNVTPTRIRLKDPQYPVDIILNFKTYIQEDIIEQWVKIKHWEKKPLMLYSFASSMLNLNAWKYWLTQFHGDWARDFCRLLSDFGKLFRSA